MITTRLFTANIVCETNRVSHNTAHSSMTPDPLSSEVMRPTPVVRSVGHCRSGHSSHDGHRTSASILSLLEEASSSDFVRQIWMRRSDSVRQFASAQGLTTCFKMCGVADLVFYRSLHNRVVNARHVWLCGGLLVGDCGHIHRKSQQLPWPIRVSTCSWINTIDSPTTREPQPMTVTASHSPQQ